MAEAVGTDGSKKPTWEVTVRQEQQLFYEMLGDRDWDNYEKTKLEYLERNVGYAMYGPPDEMPDVNKNGGTGYTSKKLEHIRKVCATIQEHSKCPSTEGKDGDVWVSIIFVCLNSKEGSVPIPVFRIPNCTPNKPSDSTSCSGKETSTDAKLKKKSTDICHQFIDSNCRVYKDWKHFLETNKLPKCTYCYPSGGVYNGNENDEVLVEFGTTPASRFTSRLCSALDTTGSVVMVGGMAVSVAAMFATVAAPVAAAATVGAVSTGVYGAGRSVAALVDRGKHRQSVGIDDSEARSCWLNMLGNSLGIASGQAVRVLSNMAQKGQVLCKAGRLMVTALNFGSLAVNGLGLVNNFVALRERARQGELTPLEVFQFASSLLFFSMSAVNVKTADSIIRETQNGVIGDFEASLRSNRHRRAFRRVARETRGAEGESMHGNAKVIKGITHIDNKDDFFAGIVRVQKQLGKSGAKVSLTDAGLVDINGELHLHPMRFSQIDKVRRQVILDATKNLKKGAWSQARFDEEVHTICQEQKIMFESQRRDTAPSVDERIPDGQAFTKQTNYQTNWLSEMKVNLHILTYQLKNFAKEHHNKIITIAINLAEMTGFKQTAEFLKIVQIIAQLTEQTVREVEEKYQQDLLAAQNYLGANFDRKQFDDNYHIQGCREENFVKAILNNYNTYAALSQLKTFLQTFFKKENKSSQNDSKQQSNQGGPQNKKDGSKATPVGTVGTREKGQCGKWRWCR